MRRPQLIFPVLLTLISVSTTVAQTGDGQAAGNHSHTETIAVARIPYTLTSAISGSTGVDTKQQNTNDDKLLAQVPLQRPGRPIHGPDAYPRVGYPNIWAEPGNGRHAAIGALIGFGLGAALGAKANHDHHPGMEVRASLLFGTFGALIGAAAGYGAPSMHSWAGYRHRQRGSEKDELASKAQHTNRSVDSASDSEQPDLPHGTR